MSDQAPATDAVGTADAAEQPTHSQPRFGRAHIDLIARVEDLIRYAVAVVLTIVAVLVLYHTIEQVITSNSSLDEVAVNALNGVLFAIIVMEVMGTVLAHFEHSGFQLQPFLIIGIISAVREILSVGARLSLATGSAEVPSKLHLALLELGVNAIVVLILSVALVLVRGNNSAEETA